ncbi:hypothetical protein FACS1894166_05250 [Bacilli bacterium]|nr:hypothetical protein FACS1894166_05250 [Bacilli bacterium]
MATMAYGVQNEMWASTTVKKPRLKPTATQVDENNNAKLIPVMASGFTIVNLVAKSTVFFWNGFAFHMPKQVTIAMIKAIGTTTTDNNKVFNNALINESFSNSFK